MSFKEKFIKNRPPESSGKKIILKKPDSFERIILITSDKKSDLFDKIKLLFKNAEISHLYLRKEKQDSSEKFTYTVHPSDFNLTGHLKNDKLMKLLQAEFDLTIDLCPDSILLNYFVSRIKSTLITGKSGTEMEAYFDLLLQENLSDYDFPESLSKYLLIFAPHE